MSLSNDPANKPKPVLQGKNPHNYRKVGYSMIVISVSLTVIGLLSWNLSDNYHFSSNIMALQEVDTMTPKSGYNIVLFDVSQPVGAKLMLLDSTGTLDAARQLQSQDEAQNPGSTLQVLIFNATTDYNLNQMAGAEVFLQTPKTGYNVVLDNYNLAVGQKLTLGSHQESLANATSYEQQQQDQIQGQEVKILIFTPSFADNLMMVTNSSMPVANYTLVLKNTASAASSTPQTPGNQTTPVASSGGSNATAVATSQMTSSQTVTVAENKTAVTATNQTVMISPNPNATSVAANKTTVMLSNPAISTVTANKTASMASNQTNTASSKTEMNTATSAKVAMNATATVGISKSVSLNETVGLNATGK
ncbi:MAG: hypothetical protein ACREBI_04895 [Nitrosotalea sp.]